MKNRLVHLLVSLSAASLVVGAGATLVAQEPQSLSGLRFRFPGAVYTMSNAPDRNAVLIFDRLADGRLVRAGAVSTGGTGTGAGLGKPRRTRTDRQREMAARGERREQLDFRAARFAAGDSVSWRFSQVVASDR